MHENLRGKYLTAKAHLSIQTWDFCFTGMCIFSFLISHPMPSKSQTPYLRMHTILFPFERWFHQDCVTTQKIVSSVYPIVKYCITHQKKQNKWHRQLYKNKSHFSLFMQVSLCIYTYVQYNLIWHYYSKENEQYHFSFHCSIFFEFVDWPHFQLILRLDI